VRVITWNVNSIGVRGERLLALLERHQPDVVCLQELKCESERFPAEAAGGYKWVAHGQKTYNGVAILSREHEIEVIERGFADGASRLIDARIGEWRIASVYCPNGEAVGSDKYKYKLEWFANLSQYLNQTPLERRGKWLVAGDYNIAPADLDCHDPEGWRGSILCSAPERDAFFRLLCAGFVDLFRYRYPNDKVFTWWDYRAMGFDRDKGMRIDHFLASKDAAEKCSRVWVDREERAAEKPSDHAPVIADFDD
jgi:exodeoxyribonuclease III